jgi:integrase/DNA-binding transcriptional regulator YhcF (GntR family)
VETLPSGAVRVRVYSGIDPVTKRKRYLREVVPPGPQQKTEAKKALTRLQRQVDEKLQPKTDATVTQLVSKYLDQHEGERSTLRTYRGYVDKHVEPLLGHLKVGQLDAEVLDSFYAELRRCRDHCSPSRRMDHWFDGEHECDMRCKKHVCQPLKASGIRQIHFILSGAYQRAVRWHWVGANPLSSVSPPSPTPANPSPPSVEDAARIIAAASKNPDWGVFVWLTMITGSRRGEMCAVRWRHFDPDKALLRLEKAVGQDGSEIFEKETKTHQSRRIALDPGTVALLQEHRQRCVESAALLGVELGNDAFMFSPDPDGAHQLKPSSVTQRFGRLAKKLGIRTHLHALRHYSATELIAGGVDVRTVAGRLGHGGGGATLLRVYSAWVSESDQRAAPTLSGRMPARPTFITDPVERAKVSPTAVFEKVAADVRDQLLNGKLRRGDPLPRLKVLAQQHEISVGTAHRALDLLKKWGYVEASRGHGAVVVKSVETDSPQPVDKPSQVAPRTLLDLELVCSGASVRKLRTETDPDDFAALRSLLVDAVKRHGGATADLGAYELNVRSAGSDALMTTVVASGCVADAV